MDMLETGCTESADCVTVAPGREGRGLPGRVWRGPVDARAVVGPGTGCASRRGHSGAAAHDARSVRPSAAGVPAAAV
jgi:hypothetical protein